MILNLQPTAAMAYDVTGTGEWLANCGACPVPEFTCALGRCGIKAATVNGLLGMDTSSAGPRPMKTPPGIRLPGGPGKR